jgi:glycerophosphoryl diester phosphodiesterase
VKRIGHGGPIARVYAIARGLGSRGRTSREARRTLVVGHRGAAREEAENTLPSFERALERDADAVEADVCVTRGGRFVVWHDADPDERVALARQAGFEKLRFQPEVPDLGSPWRRPVRELTLAEFLLHHRYVDGDGRRAEPITLDELLDWARGRDTLTDLFLDVKLDESQARDGAALVELIEKRCAREELPVIHLLCPCEPVVREMAARAERSAERIRASADFELPGADRIAPRTGAPDVSLGCGERFWTGFRGDVLACLRERDRGVFGMVTAWTISEERRLRDLARDGVDAILTDDAALLRGIVDSLSSRAQRGIPSKAANGDIHGGAERDPSSLRSSG